METQSGFFRRGSSKRAAPGRHWRLPLLIVVLIICAYAQPDTLTMTTNWTSAAEGGSPAMAINTIHNYSSVPLTAWLIISKVKKKVGWFEMSSSVKDTLLLATFKEIPPGGQGPANLPTSGDPTNIDYRLVAGVFADGSLYGDVRWAGYILERRRNIYQINQNAISDLAALRTLPQSDWVDFLEKSRQHQLMVAKGRQSDKGAVARRLLGETKLKTFEEDTTELKDANIEEAGASDMVSSIGVKYDTLIRWFGAAGTTPSPEKKLDLAIASCQDTVRKVTESRPALFSAATPTGPTRTQ